VFSQNYFRLKIEFQKYFEDENTKIEHCLTIFLFRYYPFSKPNSTLKKNAKHKKKKDNN